MYEAGMKRHLSFPELLALCSRGRSVDTHGVSKCGTPRVNTSPCCVPRSFWSFPQHPKFIQVGCNCGTFYELEEKQGNPYACGPQFLPVLAPDSGSTAEVLSLLSARQCLNRSLCVGVKLLPHLWTGIETREAKPGSRGDFEDLAARQVIWRKAVASPCPRP